MLGAGVRLPGGLSLRPAREADAVFQASLYSSTRDDLRILPDRDLAESLIELQFRAQTEGYGNDFPDAMHFVVELHDERIGRLILDFSRGTVHIVDISFIPLARGHGGGVQVRLESTTPGAMLRYTTDGSTPTLTHGTEVVNDTRLLLTEATTLKVVAYKPGLNVSAVAEAEYRIAVRP